MRSLYPRARLGVQNAKALEEEPVANSIDVDDWLGAEREALILAIVGGLVVYPSILMDRRSTIF